VLTRRFGPTMADIDWEHKLEAMPGSAPPKWTFATSPPSVAAPDRFWELLESGRAEPARQDPLPGTGQ
jgi:hypothetical protein